MFLGKLAYRVNMICDEKFVRGLYMAFGRASGLRTHK